MTSKRQFSHGTIVSPENANGWQNPTHVSRADYPEGTTQWDLPEGMYFTPKVHIGKDLTGFDGNTTNFLSGTGELTSPWGGLVSDKPLGYAHTAPFHTVDVAAGCILDTDAVRRCWTAQPVQVPDGEISFIFVDNTGLINTDDRLPSRVVPHTPLARIIASGDLTEVEDLRPHTFAGAHNDTPMELVNTEVKTSAYQAQPWERVLVNTSGGSVPITLPENPRDGDRVAMLDVGGALNAFPAIIGAKKEIIGEVATPVHAISQQAKDWIFNVGYTYIVLVFSEAEGSWFFEEIPDGNCDASPGSFIGCGGQHPTITTPEECVAPFNWNATRQVCNLPMVFGVYASRNPGETYYVVDDNACRCAYRLEAGARCFEKRGHFIRCESGRGIYENGSGGELTILNDASCIGSRRGDFLRCNGNTGIYQSKNNSPFEETWSLPKDPRCMDPSFQPGSLLAKRGFVEAYMQPVVEYRRLGSGLTGEIDEEGNSEDASGFFHEVSGGFGSSADNNRQKTDTIVQRNWAPRIANASWARITIRAKCTNAPCAVRTRVIVEYRREGEEENNRLRVAETNMFLGQNVPAYLNAQSQEMIWVPISENWRNFRLECTASGNRGDGDRQSARITFFSDRQRLRDLHYNQF